MNKDEYEYDIAFSFLAEDEQLAYKLNDLIQDRARTFLYSKKQEKLAGNDGEERFNEIFTAKARIVCVLYRNGWGKSPWTRIEETAIRNRAYNTGYEFVIFIPLDESPTVPKWLPKTQLYIGLKRWGLDGAASVLESKIQEQGGKPHEESVENRAARLERELEIISRRKQFLNSVEGVNAANAEYNELEQELRNHVEDMKQRPSSAIKLAVKKGGGRVVVVGFGLGLSTDWIYHYANTLNDAELIVSLWRGHPKLQGLWVMDEQQLIEQLTFHFDQTVSEQLVWAEESKKRQYTTKDLATFLVKRFLDEVHKTKTSDQG